MMNTVERWRDEQRRGSEKNLLAWLRNDSETMKAYEQHVASLPRGPRSAPQPPKSSSDVGESRGAKRRQATLKDFEAWASSNGLAIDDLKKNPKVPKPRGRPKDATTPEKIRKVKEGLAAGLKPGQIGLKLYPGVAAKLSAASVRSLIERYPTEFEDVSRRHRKSRS